MHTNVENIKSVCKQQQFWEWQLNVCDYFSASPWLGIQGYSAVCYVSFVASLLRLGFKKFSLFARAFLIITLRIYINIFCIWYIHTNWV